MKVFSFFEDQKKVLAAAAFITTSMFVPWCTALARDWRKINVPQAVCGNGEPYSIFLSVKDPQRLTLEFQGGGACWNQSSCKGPLALASLYPIKAVPKQNGGIDSDDPAESPIANESILFLPYCTGDVFVGTHVAHYGSATVHHEGGLNFEKSLRYFSGMNEISLENLQSLTLYGASAGAIGAMLHSASVEKYLGKETRKFIIADSPGMHWGNTFWDRFSDQFKTDVSDALKPFQMALNPRDGNLASQMAKLCKTLSTWQIAFLQSDEDFVMSTIFGSISPSAHSKLVYGPTGLAAVTKDPADNCSSWISHSQTHIFMQKNQSAGTTAGGTSALEYVSEELLGRGGKNYADRP